MIFKINFSFFHLFFLLLLWGKLQVGRSSHKINEKCLQFHASLYPWRPHSFFTFWSCSVTGAVALWGGSQGWCLWAGSPQHCQLFCPPASGFSTGGRRERLGHFFFLSLDLTWTLALAHLSVIAILLAGPSSRLQILSGSGNTFLPLPCKPRVVMDPTVLSPGMLQCFLLAPLALLYFCK